MADIKLGLSATGSFYNAFLGADDIQPGASPSYELCKQIYSYHPMGAKMVERPLEIAMAKPRTITVHGSPEDMVVDAFNEEWERLGCDGIIFNVMRISRIYGVSALVYGAKGKDTNTPIDPKELPDLDLYFNVLDPLNTAGSLVLNQDPNAPDFQKPTIVTAAGQGYHPSRSVVKLNEEPIYIEYSTSAFGFVGRSVYQRALFPLKSFIQSMIADDQVLNKSGLIVARIRGKSSIADALSIKAQQGKSDLLKSAKSTNVISVGAEDHVETLNMSAVAEAITVARKNVVENIAMSGGMPAKILNEESFAEGFGEGTEDAKIILQYANLVRDDMQPLYNFMDEIVMRRAWSPAFFEVVKANFPEYKNKKFNTVFNKWREAFCATWPNLAEEPESKVVETEDVKLKAIISLLQVMNPMVNQENRATLIKWAQDNFNELEAMFPQELDLNIESLRKFDPMVEAEKLKAAGGEKLAQDDPRAPRPGYL